MAIALVVGILVVVIAAIHVFLWVVNDAQLTGLVPAMLGDWTVGFLLTFILHLIFWELVLVGIGSVLVALIVYFGWYQRLPLKERKGYEKSSRKSGDSGGVSFFASLLWLGIVWFSGLWNKPFQNWSFNEWVYTWLTAWGIVLGIVFILGAAYVIYALNQRTK